MIWQRIGSAAPPSNIALAESPSLLSTQHKISLYELSKQGFIDFPSSVFIESRLNIYQLKCLLTEKNTRKPKKSRKNTGLT
jgi:hypothetical protein